MTVKEKQDRLLPLFEYLTTLTRERIPIDQRDPRLKQVGILPRGTLFSCFHKKHLEEATTLYEVLYAAGDFDDFYNLAKQARDIVNEGLFVYSVSVAILHRDDCKGITVPPIQEIFPDRFIPAETINVASKEATHKPNEDVIVDVEETGNILDPEHRLAYYREDVAVNAHHWHWHIAYPATWNPGHMGSVKDRKGELFFYMHQQMCARYDCERLSNGMNRMIPFHNFEEGLEGYAPHLTSLVSGLNYGSRPEGFSLKDLRDVDVQDMERWRERILESIHLGYVHGKGGEKIPLTEENGIDVLGAIIESSFESKNANFYGSLHNWGHVMMARMHDPDGRFQENPGVMSDTSTSLRDPIFYRWHRFIDNIFQDYKATLKPYTKADLTFNGIKLTDLEVNAKTKNVITTFMKENELDLSHGINFGTDHKVKVRYQHLDHEPFSYSITVENTTGAAKESAVRIFLAPRYDELGNLLTPEEGRRMYIELDKFHYTFPAGKSTLNRNAIDSNVTISKVPTFDSLKTDGVTEDYSEFCSCGWPEHMLVPRGNLRGKPFVLFVIITDYEQDKVEDFSQLSCLDAFSYCGAKSAKYPTKRPMGFPFDRPIEHEHAHELFSENHKTTLVTIKFLG